MTSPTGEDRTVPGSPGDVLTLIGAGSATTRSDLARITGLARSTISQRVDQLIESRLVSETESGESTGGRPPRQLRLRTADNLVAGVDLGATHCRVALLDISGRTLASCEDHLLIAEGPETVLAHASRRIRDLLAEADRPVEALKAIGMGVPGPVEFATGRPNNPPIMPGWNEYPIPEFFAERYGDAIVLVDNDVNVMALGEHRSAFQDTGYLLFVKVGTGIGCGIIAQGRLHRGAQGSAGDIGHIRVSGHEDAGCRCGNSACLEAVAGGGALARRLTELGFAAESGSDVVALVQGGNTQALRLVREAGRLIGEVLASLVNFFNPEVIVIGGVLARIHDHLLAGIRETVYRRSLPLATHHLAIVPTRTGADAAALGAGILAIEHFLAPDNINRIVNDADDARPLTTAGG
ncbi:ROK family transcriptional regulator [Thermopolyspora sp. NPDC052614]|uniref:ROK family transcriptional regulator n=1 Tax=Thermopolyspora sp. NPDC052614 TaxID=3155682 RepID=UPI00341988CF